MPEVAAAPSMLSRPLVIAAAVAGLLVAGTLALWLHYGTAVFYEIVPNTPHGRVDGPASGGHGANAQGAGHGEPDTTDLLIALPEQSVVSPGS